jgi:SOS response regulatory protein OraA/RecX
VIWAATARTAETGRPAISIIKKWAIDCWKRAKRKTGTKGDMQKRRRKMASSDRIKEAMETLLKIFKEDNLEKVARAVFRGGDIPADKWSFLNRVLMYLNETDDARGFRQWQEVGRYVKKGSKAFYTLNG